MMAWRFRRWRAAHYCWLANEAWRRNPCRRTEEALDRADAFYARVTASRP